MTETMAQEAVAARDAAAETILRKLETLDLPFDTSPVCRIRSAIMKGIPVVPIMPGQKRPGDYRSGRWVGLSDWRRYTDTTLAWNKLEQWEAGAKGGAGVGVLTGEIVGIDIDILDPDLADQVTDATVEMLGPTDLIRTGRAPKRLLVYRAKEPFSKMLSPAFTVAGQKCRIEALGRGQQFVADGVHPDTGEPYRWSNRSILSRGVQHVPWITREQVSDLVSRFEFLADAAGGKPAGTADDAGDHQSADTPLGNLATLTAAIPHVPGSDDYDTWVRTGLALKRALPDQPVEAFDLWDSWSQRAPHLYDPHVCAERWETFDVDNRDTPVGAGTILKAAYANGWDGRADASMDFEPLPEELPVASMRPRAQSLAFDDIQAELDVPYLLREILPPVGVAHLYGRKGSRKSQIAIDLALAVAGDTDWCGIPTEHGAVLFSAAEGLVGMKARVAAIRTVRRLSGLPFQLRLGGFSLMKGADVNGIIDEGRKLQDRTGQKLRLLVLDTLTKHSGGKDMNDPAGMAQISGAMTQIAFTLECCVLSLHHPGKDAGRGMRGAEVLGDEADAVLYVEAKGNRSTVRDTKLRDGEEGSVRLAFVARLHALGADSYGREVRAPFVDPTQASAEDDFADTPAVFAGQDADFIETLPANGDWIDTKEHIEMFKEAQRATDTSAKDSSLEARYRNIRGAMEASGEIELRHPQVGRKNLVLAVRRLAPDGSEP